MSEVHSRFIQDDLKEHHEKLIFPLTYSQAEKQECTPQGLQIETCLSQTKNNASRLQYIEIKVDSVTILAAKEARAEDLRIRPTAFH